jgi:hypothetical protein
VVKAGVPGEGEEPADALFGVRSGEGVPDRWRECARFAEAGQGVGSAVDAVPDGNAGVAGCGGEGIDWDASLGCDVFEAALPRLVLLAEPVWVDVVAGARDGLKLPEPSIGEELPDDAFAASGEAGDLAGAVSLSGERAELAGGGGSSSGGGWAALLGTDWGAGWWAAVSRMCAAVVSSRAAMTWTGRPERMSGCRSLGLMSPGWGPGQVMPVTQSKGGSQVTGSSMPAWRSRKRARWWR